jgi:hypothetical protein
MDDRISTQLNEPPARGKKPTPGRDPMSSASARAPFRVASAPDADLLDEALRRWAWEGGADNQP